MDLDDFADGDWSDFGEKTDAQRKFEWLVSDALNVRAYAESVADKLYAQMVRLAVQYNNRKFN